MSLHTYNSHGWIKLTANNIKVSIAAIKTNGDVIQKSHIDFFEKPIDLEETILISFAAEIALEGKTKTSFIDIDWVPGKSAADTYPEIGKALAEAIKKMRKEIE